MQAFSVPVGQRVVRFIYKYRYWVTGFLILLNVVGIHMARSTPAGRGKEPSEVAALKPYRENEFLLESMNSQMTPVPEPGSAGLLFGGLVMLLLKRSSSGRKSVR